MGTFYPADRILKTLGSGHNLGNPPIEIWSVDLDKVDSLIDDPTPYILITLVILDGRLAVIRPSPQVIL